MLKALLFDMGGTLEDVAHSPECNIPCGKKILSYLETHGIGIGMEPEEFMRRCEEKNKEYRRWGQDNQRELSPYEIWSRYYLKDFNIGEEKLRIIAENLANIWERNFYTRSLRKDAPAMLERIRERGLAMGIISNTASLTHVIENLHEMGIHRYFAGCIYLSSLSGYRKPGRAIFIEAAADLGVKPFEAAYAGDTVSRDVRGARDAGYLATIRIASELTAGADAGFNTQGEEADYFIRNLSEIPGIVDLIVDSSRGI
ncbi:MAG: HAD family hydrolase [Treponema sp.]|jgi:putative hydrolase of the HAD superfamily|nr:HAD family hydrolase [Treponema sp.]